MVKKHALELTTSFIIPLVRLLSQQHMCIYTVEPPNNGHVGDEQVVPSSEVEMYGQLMEAVCPLSSYRSVHYRRFYCIPEITDYH